MHSFIEPMAFSASAFVPNLPIIFIGEAGWLCIIEHLWLAAGGSTNELSEREPVRLGNEDASFECDQMDFAELLARYPDVDFAHAWQFVRVFRSGPRLMQNVASWIGAVTFAKVTGAKVFDPREGKLYAPEEVLSSLRKVERDILELEDELKKIKERPRKALASSPAVISVSLWKEDQAEGDS